MAQKVLKKTRKTLQLLVKSFFVGMTGFEPATTRPPDAYSNRAELHPAHLRLQRYEHFTNKQDYCKKYFHQYKKLFMFFQKIIYCYKKTRTSIA